MRRRIVICLGLLLALFLIGNAIAMLCLDRSVRQLGELAELRRIQSLRTTLNSDAIRMQAGVLSRLAGRDQGGDEHEARIVRFDRSLTGCSRCHHVPAIQARLDQVRETFERYRAASDELCGGDPFEVAASITDEATSLVDELVAETTAIHDLARVHLIDHADEAGAGIRSAWVVLLGTFVAALVCGGVVAVHLERRLTRPMAALLENTDRMRSGDVPDRLTVKADEEFRLLGDAIHQAYVSLKGAQEGILQAEKMASVGKLAAGVAHEVGNPLASISSVAQVMRKRCTSQEQREQIDLIMAQIARITRITRDLLAFSGRVVQERRDRVDLRPLLEQATTLLGYDRRSADIRIVCRHDPHLAPVRGDADRLLLVITNIMLNAFDAIAEKHGDGGHLTITTQTNGDRVVLRFDDDGKGMSDAQVTSAFEAFFTTKEPGRGTGLGLWVSYQVVRRHGGTIQLESRLGHGTTVTVELPRAQSSADRHGECGDVNADRAA